MKVNVEFVTLKEVGELQPAIEEPVSCLVMNVPAVPRFKDRIQFEGHLYYVNDVIYEENIEGIWRSWEICIKAARKIRTYES